MYVETGCQKNQAPKSPTINYCLFDDKLHNCFMFDQSQIFQFQLPTMTLSDPTFLKEITNHPDYMDTLSIFDSQKYKNYLPRQASSSSQRCNRCVLPHKWCLSGPLQTMNQILNTTWVCISRSNKYWK